MYGFKKSQIVFYYKFDPFPPSQGIDPDFKFMENLRVRYREILFEILFVFGVVFYFTLEEEEKNFEGKLPSIDGSWMSVENFC